MEIPLAKERFWINLRRALNHLYDPSVLRHSELIDTLGLGSHSNPVWALQSLLTEGVESLKPPQRVAAGSKSWRMYQVLRSRFVEQIPQRQVAADLGLSIRQLRREEQRARDALAEHLWYKYAGETRGPGPRTTSFLDRDGAPSAIVTVPTRAQELEWLRNTVPQEMARIGDIIRDVQETVAPLLESSDVSFEHSPGEGLSARPLKVPILRQTLLNIISTAVRCVPAGRVTIRESVADREGVVTVRAIMAEDSTCGPREYAEGMEMAHRLVRLLDASLEVTPGKAVDELFTAKLTMPAVDRKTVLVIDDNADTLHLFQRYLAGSEYRFVGAQDTDRGLELATRLRPQAIVLDVMMPGEDGWALLGQLREHPEVGGTPVVVCTILAEQELALALGAAGFIRKPVSRTQLLTALDEQLGRRATARL